MFLEGKLPPITAVHSISAGAEQTAAQRNNFCTILPATVFYNAAIASEEEQLYEEEDNVASPSATSSLLTPSLPLSPSLRTIASMSAERYSNNTKRRSRSSWSQNMRKISTLARSRSLQKEQRLDNAMSSNRKNDSTQSEMRNFQQVIERLKLTEQIFSQNRENYSNEVAVKSDNETNKSHCNDKFVDIEELNSRKNSNVTGTQLSCVNRTVESKTEKHAQLKEEQQLLQQEERFADLTEETARGTAELAKDKVENFRLTRVLHDSLQESEAKLRKVQNARYMRTSKNNEELERNMTKVYNGHFEENRCHRPEHKSQELTDEIHNQKNDKVTKSQSINTKGKTIDTSDKNNVNHVNCYTTSDVRNKSNSENEYNDSDDCVNTSKSQIDSHPEQISWGGVARNEQHHAENQENNRQSTCYSNETTRVSKNYEEEEEQEEEEEYYEEEKHTSHLPKSQLVSSVQRKEVENETTREEIEYNLRNAQKSEQQQQQKSCQEELELNKEKHRSWKTCNNEHQGFEIIPVVNEQCHEEVLQFWDDTVEFRLNELLHVINQEQSYVLPEWCEKKRNITKSNNFRESKVNKKLTCITNERLPAITHAKNNLAISHNNDHHVTLSFNKNANSANVKKDNKTSNYDSCNMRKQKETESKTHVTSAVRETWRGLGRKTYLRLQNRFFRTRECEWGFERDAARKFEDTVRMLHTLKPLREQMLYHDVLSHYVVKPIEYWGKPQSQPQLLIKDKELMNGGNDKLLLHDKNDCNIKHTLEKWKNITESTENELTSAKTAKATTVTVAAEEEKKTISKRDRNKWSENSERKYINAQSLIQTHSRNIFDAALKIDNLRRFTAQEEYISILRSQINRHITIHYPTLPRLLEHCKPWENTLSIECNVELKEERMLEKERKLEWQHYNNHSEKLQRENMQRDPEMSEIEAEERREEYVRYLLRQILDKCLHLLHHLTNYSRANFQNFVQIIETSQLTPEDIVNASILYFLRKLSKLFCDENETFDQWASKLQLLVNSTTDYLSRFRQTDI